MRVMETDALGGNGVTTCGVPAQLTERLASNDSLLPPTVKDIRSGGRDAAHPTPSGQGPSGDMAKFGSQPYALPLDAFNPFPSFCSLPVNSCVIPMESWCGTRVCPLQLCSNSFRSDNHHHHHHLSADVSKNHGRLRDAAG
jgi:hypothetical protein